MVNVIITREAPNEMVIIICFGRCPWCNGYRNGARGEMVIVVGNGHGDTSSNPDCISHSTNTLGNGMNPIILPPAMSK